MFRNVLLVECAAPSASTTGREGGPAGLHTKIKGEGS